MGPFDGFRKDGGDYNDGPVGYGLTPPSQDEAVKRALCLGALVLRGEIEHAFNPMLDAPDVQAEAVEMARTVNEGLIERLGEWLYAEALDVSQSGDERRLFSLPLGGWDGQDIIDASWRVEALCVIMWALSMVRELPPYDVMAGRGKLMSRLGLMGPAEDFAVAARLRGPAEIRRARDVAELWHWRANTARCVAGGIAPPPGVTYEEIIRRAAFAAYKAGDIPEPMEDDFPAFGKPYGRLDDEERSAALSIARERQFGLNWLCGYSADWDETPTDT